MLPRNRDLKALTEALMANPRDSLTIKALADWIDDQGGQSQPLRDLPRQLRKEPRTAKGASVAHPLFGINHPNCHDFLVVTRADSHWMDWEIYEVIGWHILPDGGSGAPAYWFAGSSQADEAVEDLDEAMPWMEGHINWDGCYEWTCNEEMPIHMCDRDGAKVFGKLIDAIYDIAAEQIPHWNGDRS